MVISRFKILIHLLKEFYRACLLMVPFSLWQYVLYIMALLFTFQSGLLIYLLLRCIKFLCYTLLKLKTISVRLNQVIKYHMNYLFQLYHTSYYWNLLLQTLQSVAHSHSSQWLIVKTKVKSQILYLHNSMWLKNLLQCFIHLDIFFL